MKYLMIVRVSLLERLAYGFDLFARSGILILFIFVLSRLWIKAVPSGGLPEGLDAAALTWYVMITESVLLSMPPLGARIDSEVKSGAFSAFMLRPCSYPLFHYFSFLGEAAASVAANMSVGIVTAYALAGPPPMKLVSLPLVSMALFLGVTLNFTFLASLAMLSLWFEDNEPFFWIYGKMVLILGGVLIPLDFFPGVAGKAAMFLPFGKMFYGPARLAVAYDSGAAVSLIVSQSCWIAVGASMLWAVYCTGRRQVANNGG